MTVKTLHNQLTLRNHSVKAFVNPLQNSSNRAKIKIKPQVKVNPFNKMNFLSQPY